MVYLGSDNCEVSDVIRQTGCGIQVREDDAEGLIRACEVYLNNPARILADGSAGLRIFNERYEISRVLPRLADFMTLELK